MEAVVGSISVVHCKIYLEIVLLKLIVVSVYPGAGPVGIPIPGAVMPAGGMGCPGGGGLPNPGAAGGAWNPVPGCPGGGIGAPMPGAGGGWNMLLQSETQRTHGIG